MTPEEKKKYKDYWDNIADRHISNTKVIFVRTDPLTHAAINKIAKESKCSVSEFVNRLVKKRIME
jgi:predicted HicB family RNase H-like nuclease